MRRGAHTLLAGVIALATGCASPASAVSEPDASTSDPNPGGFGPLPVSDDLDASLGSRAMGLFHGTCAGTSESFCHANAAGGLIFDFDLDGGDVIDVRSSERPDLLRVKPYDPSHSYVYLKVLGDGGIDGSAMPPSTVDAKIPELVGAWISAGAPLQ